MAINNLAAGTTQFERHTDVTGRQFTWIGDQWFPARVNEDNEGTGSSLELNAALAATVIVRGTATRVDADNIGYVLDGDPYLRVITRSAGVPVSEALYTGSAAILANIVDTKTY